MKKLNISEFIILIAISLMIIAISGKIIMSYPFLIVDKNNLKIIEQEGWVRYVKTTGKYTGQTLWFSEGGNKNQIKLVCIEEDSNYVSSQSCNLSNELLKEMPHNKNYTKWTKAKVKISHINIPILSSVFKEAILIEK